MKNYIGTKEVQAEPMVLGEFINKSGKNPYSTDSKIHSQNEEGYLVKYEDGFESWSPKKTFDKAYRRMEDYHGQSGFFKVDDRENMVACVGGDKNHKSFISIGILNVSLNGIKEFGLHFLKCKTGTTVNEEIEDFENTIDTGTQSFMFIPHSTDAVDFLIECLEAIKNEIKSKNK